MLENSAKYKKLIALIFLLPALVACGQDGSGFEKELTEDLGLPNVNSGIKTGAENTAEYIEKLRGKKVAVVANQTSVIDQTHLVDTLISLGIEVKKVFAPEHGFRGAADAGEEISSTTDKRTGLPIISLYGSSKKPTATQLENIDIIVFDIQDVGVRYYTYISTLHYVMEAAANFDIPVILLDRPNPNGFYVDGPVLKKEHSSFIGMHSVPVVYGLTIGEYGLMINGEGWLETDRKCDLEVVELSNYTHESLYNLPINPSPNLPDMNSIYLYPSIGFIEGTNASEGRGTPYPFQVCGEPGNTAGDFEFIPKSMYGAKHPKHEGKVCKGFDLRDLPNLSDPAGEINLSWLIKLYNGSPDKAGFFMKNGFFNKLAGNAELVEKIKMGISEAEIKKSWQKDIDAYLQIRSKYLLYPDFSQ